MDLASRDSATVGGTVATNAGGLHVLRYGATPRPARRAEAVLGTGSVVSHLGGLLKDNTGYDLAGLLCGSEGTLGVVTAARLRLVPPAPRRVVALLAFDAVAPAVHAAGHFAGAHRRWTQPSCSCPTGSTGPPVLLAPAPFPRPHSAFLLVEVADTGDPTDGSRRAIDSLEAVADVAVALDPGRASELWRYREAHTEAINSLGPPHKLDVTLPGARLAGFIDQVPAVVAGLAPGAHTWLFGHAADGNVHVNVTGVAADDDRVDEAVLRAVAEAGGSISAEHGIGVAKRRWLSLNRSGAEIDAFRAIKGALDPDGILNPRVLLPPLVVPSP